VKFITGSFGLSARRGCDIVDMPRSSYSYKKKLKPDEEDIRNKLKELAEAKPKYGYRMLHVLLRRKGYAINHKRTERIYGEEKLSLRKKRKRRKTGSMYRTEVPKSERQNHIWSMDFVSDAVSSNRKLKMLNVVDTFTRKCLDILVDTSINGYRVCRVLDGIVEREGSPDMIIVDNGPEFTGRALDEWAYRKGIKIHFIRPGKPVENAYIESFNGRLREECLNSHWFTSLDHARLLVSDWKSDYNENRPHSSLGYLSPNEFIRKEASNQRDCVVEYSNS
jgi:putative transposase